MKIQSWASRVILSGFVVVCFSRASCSQCTVKSYKVASPLQVTVTCDENNTAGLTGTATFTSTSQPPQILSGTVSGYPNNEDSLLITISSPLSVATKYKLTIRFSPAVNPQPAPIDVDTTSSFAVVHALSSAHPKTFRFVSNVLVYRKEDIPCSLTVQDALNNARPVDIQTCSVPVTKKMTQDPSKRIDDVQDIGLVNITLKKEMSQQVIPMSLGGIVDVFGKTPRIESKSRLVTPKAPASKDAASYYINFSDLAATGTSPSWAIDGRIAPPMGRLYHRFQLNPLATASVGLGQISGQSYTDTINFGVTANRIFQLNSVLQYLQLTPGVIYESDREFDRHNLLGAVDLRFSFAHSYNTRLRQQENMLQRAIEREEEKKKHANERPPGDSDSPITWTLDDFKPPIFGYVYDLHALVEAGGALVDTTVHATKGSAVMTLPSYNIARLGSKLHSLIELGRVSVDTTFVGRYLAQTEYSVLQTPKNTLYLKTLSGWKGYLTLSGSLGLDADGHFAITVTYQDGFNPPKFNRSNCVLTGITLKY